MLARAVLRSTRRVVATVAVLLAATALVGAQAQTAVSTGASQLTEKQLTRAVTDAIGHHSFTPPLLRAYYGEGEIPHWTLTGTTVVTDNYIRLTPDASSCTGHLWNTEPLDMDAFEIVVGFRVNKQIPGASADGFAIWLTTEPPRSEGPIFGHPMSFVGAGFLFDTYDNDNMKDNPMASVIYNRPEDRDRQYSPNRDFRGETKGHCVFDYRSTAKPRMATARIVYNRGHVELFMSKDNEVSEKLCFSVDNVYLDTDNVKYFLGLTANTGGVSANHEIIFVHLSPVAGHVYTHDIHATRNPTQAGEDAAFHNYAHDKLPQEEGAEQEGGQVPQEQQQQQQQQQQQTPPPPPEQPPQEQQQQEQQTPPPPPPSPPPQPPQDQQQQYQQPPPPPPPQQQQQQYQQPPPTQYQQQYQQPPPPPPQQQQQQQQYQQGLDDKARLEILERELAALRRRQNPPPGGRRDDDDWDDVDDEYYDDDRGMRRRRARTNRGRRDY